MRDREESLLRRCAHLVDISRRARKLHESRTHIKCEKYEKIERKRFEVKYELHLPFLSLKRRNEERKEKLERSRLENREVVLSHIDRKFSITNISRSASIGDNTNSEFNRRPKCRGRYLAAVEIAREAPLPPFRNGTMSTSSIFPRDVPRMINDKMSFQR